MQLPTPSSATLPLVLPGLLGMGAALKVLAILPFFSLKIFSVSPSHTPHPSLPSQFDDKNRKMEGSTYFKASSWAPGWLADPWLYSVPWHFFDPHLLTWFHPTVPLSISPQKNGNSSLTFFFFSSLCKRVKNLPCLSQHFPPWAARGCLLLSIIQSSSPETF